MKGSFLIILLAFNADVLKVGYKRMIVNGLHGLCVGL